MQRADIFYPQLTYPARGSRAPQIKIEPIIARNTKTYPHKLGKRPTGSALAMPRPQNDNMLSPALGQSASDL